MELYELKVKIALIGVVVGTAALVGFGVYMHIVMQHLLSQV